MDLPIWPLPAPRPPRPLPPRAGVVVVGGGITGVSALYWLGLRGTDALLLERSRLAAGASGRNAGFLLMGVAANYALAVRRHGRDVAREVWHFTADNHALLASLLQGRAGYARRGSLTLAATDEESLLLRESAELLHEDSLPGTWVSPGQLVNDADGEVDPAAAVAAVADATPDARIHEGVTVLALEPSHDGVRVHTDAGEIVAGAVILATNAYTSAFAASVAIAPVRAQMLATAPVVAPVAARPTYAHWGYRYWRQRDDGRVLVGGWRDTAAGAEVGTDATVNPDVQRHLDAALQALDVAAPVTHRWAGIMGFSPDELPLVGAVAGMPNVYICGGYTGHGMGFAVNAARTLVAHLHDAAPIPAWLRAGRSTPGR
ncbi:MAG TPA: FAD-binding oxidoreductase [Candidatus Angelobacter sp.]|jgi:gamma-glutamylputrescine oxidase|nr:FAD-binding oxidoreductase [Candidatus Angelobacter sp.]